MFLAASWRTGNEAIASSLWFNKEHMSSWRWLLSVSEVSLTLPEYIWIQPREILPQPDDISRPGRVSRLLGYSLTWPILQTAQTTLTWYLLVASTVFKRRNSIKGRKHPGKLVASILGNCLLETSSYPSSDRVLCYNFMVCTQYLIWLIYTIHLQVDLSQIPNNR